MKYKLNIEVPFTDKVTGKKYHEVGKVETFSKERGEELLKDPRGLVSLNEKIEEKPKNKDDKKDKANDKKSTKEEDKAPEVVDDPNKKDITITENQDKPE